MGTSPAQFIEDLRGDAVCEAIERVEISIAKALFLFGFGSPERMRRAFQQRKGTSPSAYAARFGGKWATVLQPGCKADRKGEKACKVC